MSWAALVSQNKDQRVDFGPPKSIVYARDPEITEDDRRFDNVDHETINSITIPEFQKALLILDANALIKGMDNFTSLADAFVTTSNVVAEIRDKASRDLVQRLPHALVILDPTPESIREVVQMAERTGDLGVLSRTDIRLCALALDCCRAGGVTLEPIEPRPADINPDAGVHLMKEEVSDDDEETGEEEEQEGEEVEEGDEGEEEGDDDGHEEPPHPAAHQQPSTMPGWNDESDDDEENGHWITPENIHEMAADGTRTAKGAEVFSGGMACVTSDFAMQNTLMHLGVPILGTAGMRIRELRTWLLRCTGCFRVVTDTTKQFCPGCGSGDTLRRVNYVVNSDGERRLYINFKKRISTRGTVYNLPKPRGGKRGTNKTLVLREDQLAQVIKGASGAKLKEKQALSVFANDDDLAGFGEAPQKKKRDLAELKTTSSYKRYNINAKRKQRAARRK